MLVRFFSHSFNVCFVSVFVCLFFVLFFFNKYVITNHVLYGDRGEFTIFFKTKKKQRKKILCSPTVYTTYWWRCSRLECYYLSETDSKLNAPIQFNRYRSFVSLRMCVHLIRAQIAPSSNRVASIQMNLRDFFHVNLSIGLKLASNLHHIIFLLIIIFIGLVLAIQN